MSSGSELGFWGICALTQHLVTPTLLRTPNYLEVVHTITKQVLGRAPGEAEPVLTAVCPPFIRESPVILSLPFLDAGFPERSLGV